MRTSSGLGGDFKIKRPPYSKNRHHRKPKAQGGTVLDPENNIAIVDAIEHATWTAIFPGYKSAATIAAELGEIFFYNRPFYKSFLPVVVRRGQKIQRNGLGMIVPLGGRNLIIDDLYIENLNKRLHYFKELFPDYTGGLHVLKMINDPWYDIEFELVFARRSQIQNNPYIEEESLPRLREIQRMLK